MPVFRKHSLVYAPFVSRGIWTMKEIKAIIQPFMLDAVVDALREVDHLPAITVSEVQGISIADADTPPCQRLKLEIVVPDHIAPQVVQTIGQHARTGNPGDGRIFVIPVEQSVKIRTGQADPG